MIVLMNDLKKQRKQYSELFKQETVTRYLASGMPVNAFAKAVGVEQSVLHRWIKRQASDTAEEQSYQNTSGTNGEVVALQREVAHLREHIGILRGIIAKTMSDRHLPESKSTVGSAHGSYLGRRR